MPKLEKNLLFKSLNSLLIITQDIEANTHSHHALQVTFSMSDAFTLGVEKGQSARVSEFYHGVIIGADIEHSIKAETGPFVTLLLDPELHQAKHILGHHQTTGIMAIDDDLLQQLRQFIQLLMSEHEDVIKAKITKPIEQLMTILTQSDCEQALEPRIETLIQYIAQTEFKSANIDELAQAVNLSTGRLSHLFKEEVGIPIRRYLLWQRLLDACFYASLHAHDEIDCEMKNDMSLTQAAHQAGFTDSAHFSRTFKTMFGLHPSNFIKKSHMILASTKNVE
ncbi:helix-turn-helix domain-containing protein [Marinomonas sp. PE14-40]|uniref:helix-turn-helix domain-containing protein n=1 Tax=Marinomonas sp. PE14-40 TaxID=3060621 RepID=UPI003F664C80